MVNVAYQLLKRDDYRGKHGGKWGHGFKPKNAVAKQLKAKTFRKKGVKSRRKKKR